MVRVIVRSVAKFFLRGSVLFCIIIFFCFPFGFTFRSPHISAINFMQSLFVSHTHKCENTKIEKNNNKETEKE